MVLSKGHQAVGKHELRVVEELHELLSGNTHQIHLKIAKIHLLDILELQVEAGVVEMEDEESKLLECECTEATILVGEVERVYHQVYQEGLERTICTEVKTLVDHTL